MPDEPTPQPESTPTPEPEQTSQDPWYSSLQDDFKNNPTIQKYESPDELAKAHLNLVQKLGNEKIPLPKDDDDAVGWDEVYKRLGMPEDGKYNIEAKELPPELGQQDMEGFSKVARELRLTESQAKGLYNWYTDNALENFGNLQKAHENQMAEAQNELRKEYGAQYDQNVKLADQAFVKLFGEDGAKQMKDIVGNNPVFIKGMVNAAKQLSEDGIGKFSQTNFTKSPKEAKIELDKIMSDPHDAYWGNRDHKGQPIPQDVHKERVAYVESLNQMVASGNQ